MSTTVDIKAGDLPGLLQAVNGLADNMMPYDLADTLASAHEKVYAKVEVYVDQNNRLISKHTDGGKRIEPQDPGFEAWREDDRELRDSSVTFEVPTVDEARLRKLPELVVKGSHLRLLRHHGIVYDSEGGGEDAE